MKEFFADRIETFSTPVEIHEAVEASLQMDRNGDAYFDNTKFLKIIDTPCLPVLDHYKDYSLIYVPDAGVCPTYLLTNSEEKNNILVQTFVDIYNSIRGEITKKLRESGFDITQIDQTPKASLTSKQPIRASDGTILGYRSMGWAPDIENPADAYKYKTLIKRQFHLAPLDHPNVMNEEIFNFPSGEVLSIAPNLGDVSTLKDVFEYLTFDELTEVILGGLSGNHHIHTQGYVHCDIKPGNIIVTEKYGKKFGILFDLEGVSKFQENPKNIPGAPKYNEDYYYVKTSQVPYPMDIARDVFSWGIVLLKCFGQIPDSELEKLRNSCKKTEDPKKQQGIIQKYVDDYLYYYKPIGLPDLVKAMLSVHRENRPSIQSIQEKLLKARKIFATLPAVRNYPSLPPKQLVT